MKPQFSITSNGSDITSQIADRLLSLTVRDEAGTKSDTCSVVLSDKGQNLQLPNDGTELEVKLGYETLVSLGKYKTDEVRFAFPPATITIRAKAMPDTFKTQKTRSWDNKIIADIVSEIAAEHNLNHRIASEFATIEIEHMDQTEESDAHFLTRLAKEHGAISKPAGGTLLFIPTGEGKTASGKNLSVIEINIDEATSYSCTQKQRGKYEKIIAKYNDKETGTEKTVEHMLNSTSEDSAVKRIKTIFPTEAEALEAAKAEGIELQAGQIDVNVTIVGRPDIFAESPVKLIGFRSDPMDTNWTIRSVTHQFNSGGYTTKIACDNSD